MHSKIFLLTAILILGGAGCIGGGEINSSTDGGVWKSADSGASWKQVSAVPTPSGVSSSAGTNVISLATDPSDRNTIYAGTERDGLLYTYDGGLSWQQSQDATMRTGAITAVAVDPSDKCRIYIARADKIFRSDDCNRSYGNGVYVESKSGVIVTDLAVDWFKPEIVFASLSDGSLIKSSNMGENWTNVYRSRQPITDVEINNRDSRVIVLGTTGAGLARSENGGATWSEITEELIEYRDAVRVLALAQDAQGRALYAATYYGILHSDDMGVTWRALNLLTAPNEVAPSVLAVDPARPDTVMYAVGNSLYSSYDGGSNWSVQKLMTNRSISKIVFDRTSSNILYLGVRKIEK
jgi:photosystem II stability/assembly factor-like uncharacterized protein